MADEPRSLVVPPARPGAASNVGVALPQVPGRVAGGTAIQAVQNGLVWTINLKIGELGRAPPHDYSETWVPAWFGDSDETYRIALSDLSLSLPVAWGNITGKPSTFPPTLPIPSSGVTGLDAALAGIAGDLISLDGRLDTIEPIVATHTGQIATINGQLVTINGQLADADRGDITTSASFMTWTIDANVVDNAKLRDSAGLSVIGRASNSLGDPADIVAGTDGHVLFRSGTALIFGQLVTASYADNSVTVAKMQQLAGLSVLGNGANGAANMAALTAGTDGFVLRRSGTSLAFGTIATAGIANAAVDNTKLANMATATFKGRATAGTGDPEDLNVTQATALLNAMVGDTGTGGTKGLVPAPAAGDAAAGKVLGADGTWVNPGGLPAGLIAAFMMTAAPTGWLKANGAAVDLSVYPALIAIYCGNTDNPTALHGYRCTNPASPSSTRSTTGGYIVLPDFRGEFIRGLDDGRGVDASRSAWAAQSATQIPYLFVDSTSYLLGPKNTPPAQVDSYVGGTGTRTIIGGADSATINAWYTTRPRNLAPLICIKY